MDSDSKSIVEEKESRKTVVKKPVLIEGLVTAMVMGLGGCTVTVEVTPQEFIRIMRKGQEHIHEDEEEVRPG